MQIPQSVLARRLTPLGNGLVVFEGYTAEFGWEPWVTDGTTEGTALLADIRAGSAHTLNQHFESYPTFIPFDGEAFFLADDGIHGREVWRTDGTPAGTEMLADLVDGAAGLSGFSDIVADDDRLFIAGTPDGSPTVPLMFLFEPGH